MRVLIPSALYSYTAGQNWVEAEGGSLAEVLADLDRRYPGIRFRVLDERGELRRHMRFFHDGKIVRTKDALLRSDGELLLVQALSGG